MPTSHRRRARLYLQIVGPAALGGECHDQDHNGVSYRVLSRMSILYSIFYRCDAPEYCYCPLVITLHAHPALF